MEVNGMEVEVRPQNGKKVHRRHVLLNLSQILFDFKKIG
jgi:hypothetical protein